MDQRAGEIAGRSAPPDRPAIAPSRPPAPPAHPEASPSASDRMAAWIGIVCAVGLAVLAISVHSGPLPVDDAIRSGLGIGRPVPLLFDLLDLAGGALVWDAGVAAAVAILWIAGHRAQAAWLGASVLAAEVLASGLKLLVDRPRPPGVAVVDLVTQASFPSGHATRVAVTGAILVLAWSGRSRWRLGAAALAVLLAGLMGLARIESGEHWPTDVLGSYLVSGVVIAGAAVARSWLRRREPDLPRRPAPDRAGPGRPP